MELSLVQGALLLLQSNSNLKFVHDHQTFSHE